MEITKEKSVEQRKDMENTEENCEMIWKIWKKMVKRQGKYERKVSRNVK